jgi:ribosomal protein L40E
MILETVAAIALGVLVLWLVFEPSLAPGRTFVPLPPEPEAPEETRRGVALLALKEIEFDRATGKLSDRDYEMLKARYSAEALAALDAEEPGPAEPRTADPEELIQARLQVLRAPHSSGTGTASGCLRCGPRPEPDARFCSRCGLSLLAAGFCAQCGAPLGPGSQFCAACGNRVAA